MKFKKIIKLFESGNVLVCGLRGRGKDVLMSNVAVRRKMPYISNVDYGGDFHQFYPLDFDLGKNTYQNFIDGDVHFYEFPFPDGTDVYISDVGVLFPSQYSGQLDHKYPYFAFYAALSRHTGSHSIHCNTQAIGRIWNKFREQSDIFIMANFCVFPFARTGIPWLRDLVVQKVTIYEKYESAENRVPPYRPPRGRLNADRRFAVKQERQHYRITHGDIKPGLLIYRNKSTFDTRFYRTLLLQGKRDIIDENTGTSLPPTS